MQMFYMLIYVLEMLKILRYEYDETD